MNRIQAQSSPYFNPVVPVTNNIVATVKKPPQQIIVNNYTQATFSAQNRDNHFTVNLATQYDNVKTLQLNEFSMLNFMSNYSDQFTDFSYRVGVTTYSLTIDHVYHTLAQFFVYFNAIQSNTVLSYVEAQNYTSAAYGKVINEYLTITSTQPFSPIGVGWTMLGFGYYIAGTNAQINQLGLANATVLYPYYPFDFYGTPVIYICFNNIINASVQGDGPVSFQIENDSSFGTLLSYKNPNQYGNQFITFQQPVTISVLEISIYDVYKRLIHTVSVPKDDDTEIPICLSMTAYSE